MGIDQYKDLQKRATLMGDSEWNKTISNLKEHVHDDSKIYKISYKQGLQKKNRSFGFDSLQYVEETNSFIFTSYTTDFETGELTNVVRDKIVLRDIEIISLNIQSKSDYDFSSFLN
ncbi:hypothetical protein GCM10008018_66150 [Paenibacillus marchantiophytorum]|uniref:Uncharacterized protein n=1 Tax=Paenibacillus marchantiophytorum TaxID=1619310 RepID=A0ABQ1FG63_9BACL|nr:hypothetical protein [Paenibacillus marchantiophytorum]GGA11871.1 hypothetical protein GCM10008018_66150 [Paenibacillus marchantiophytorum]